MLEKIGLGDREGGGPLIADLLELLHAQRVDFTSVFRALSSAVEGDLTAPRRFFLEPAAFEAWAASWQQRLLAEGRDLRDVAAAMDRVNPIYVPRNHRVEETLAAATAGDLDPLARLMEALSRPFDERAGFERYAEPGPPDAEAYQTFCGT